MKNTKKVLSVALAGALAFGSMGAAFAAAPVMDAKTDKKITEAVERLSSFGIVSGMEDGKYHEEAKVTREQFAKILVEALGLGNAADAAKGATKFKDVDSSRWSAGYINVAAGQGLLKGYADGTFGPEKEVSYAEAVTMLVRALGYKDEFLSGSWPGNYVSKAADTGITDGAKFTDSTGKADRGTVAVLVDNALDSKVVKVKEYDGTTVKFEESKRTLLKDKLDVNKYENVRITGDKIVDDSLEANEVTVKFLKDMDTDDKENVKNVYGDEDKNKTFDLAKDVNVKNVIGQEVTLYLNDDNEVLYATSENDDKANFDYVQEAPSTKEVSLVKFDDDYKFADDATVYLFDGKDSYSKMDGDDVKTEDLVGKPGKFVVKNNEIVYAEVLSPNEGTPWILVKENKDGKITGINETDEKYDIDLSKDGNYDGVVAFDQNGNSIAVKDIKAGNILYVQKQDWEGDDYAVIRVVTDNVVKGKLGKVKDDRVEIEGKEIKVTRFDKSGTRTYDAYYSVDNDDNSDLWKSSDWDNDMEDAAKAQIVAYLDGAGRIAYLTTETKASSGYKYGVVTKTYADNDKVKIYTTTTDGKGDEVTYNAEESKNLKSPIKVDKYGHTVKTNGNNDLWSSDVYEGAVVKFKLNKEGEIAEDEFYMMDKANYFVMADGKDFTSDSIPSAFGSHTATKESFNVDSKAALIDAKNLTTAAADSSMSGVDVDDDFGLAKWSELSEDDYNANLKYYVFADDDNNIDAEAVIFVGNEGASSASDSEPIYVIDKWRDGGDDFVKYANEKGEIVAEKEVDKGLDSDERPYIARVKSDGKLELITSSKDEFEFVGPAVVDKKDGNILTVNGHNYKLLDNSVVYEEDTKKSKSNIAKGDVVWLIVEDGINIKVVERYTDDDAAPYKNVTASKVIDKIAALPSTSSITLSDKSKVTAARSAYDALSSTEKAKVTNLSVLTAAEAKIKDLESTPSTGDIVKESDVTVNDIMPGTLFAVVAPELSGVTYKVEVNGTTYTSSDKQDGKLVFTVADKYEAGKVKVTATKDGKSQVINK